MSKIVAKKHDPIVLPPLDHLSSPNQSSRHGQQVHLVGVRAITGGTT